MKAAVFAQRCIGAYFEQDDVEIVRGELKTYEYRSDESGRWLRTQFCPNCGTTVTWTAEALAGLRAIAGGSFAQLFEKGALQPPSRP